MIVFGIQIDNGVGHTLILFSPVYRYATDGLKKEFEGETKPFFFDQKMSLSAQGIIGQFAYNKIPVAGVWGNHQHTFVVIRRQGNGLPSGTFEQEA